MRYSLMAEQNLKELEFQLEAKTEESSFEYYRSMSARNQKRYRVLEENSRIYPGYFAPIVALKRGERVTFPMRYRVHPKDAEKEVPTCYNLYNARVESLSNKKLWKRLFSKQHGLIAYKSFYEWVTDTNVKKRVLNFWAKDHPLLYSPVLYDAWISSEDPSEKFCSFAIITKDAPKEIYKAGHDRCPILLTKENISLWLDPKNSTPKKVFSTLNKEQNVCYNFKESSG